ncbi:nucleoside triphosphate pyrophosphohydrolase [Micromonospora soli]|uniref:nucleoside triphosphate pyrophosphohydrolase n=1 Tax=Micromonospora sp. NBRC 110009 TaxID=3061627 RepID=UPI002671B08F|nr:nucleoside triphosphate pyrophosphohydrolase [Micromonospora sp. NBRC 110009]WKU00170.1 nucleoside triphosphate pyrophosphohydrolase [Micromonospora sp. NBRC 110009]
MTARIVLLVTSPRLPAGLLTAAAWDVVRSAPVLAGAESELTGRVRAAGAEVTVVTEGATQALLDAVAARGTAVWLAGATGDEALARELGLRLARQPGLAELELMYGSWDPPGARLLDAVEVMDRLASPGGDPWKRAQTHRSLAGFLLEECYEAYDAISADDTDALREELGDVLLQVLLHARLAEELPEGKRWTVDDVAGDLVDKMVRRNPHVFSGAEAGSIEEIEANWERIKRAEKTRESVLDGIAMSQPALALAAKILDRAARIGLAVPPPLADSQVDPEARLGASLLATVAAARQAGIDPEAALRRTALAYADAVRSAEAAARAAHPDQPS